MDAVSLLIDGFAAALTPTYLVAALVGVVVGTLVGILPGLGPTTTMAMLLPFTYGMDPTGMTIMFAGIFYGSKYGGAVTSILLNIPGEASSVMTAVDGHQMARQGRAGPALGIAAISSFAAGTLSVIGLMLLAPPLAEVALSMGPPEYFGMVLIGLALVTSLAGKSLLKALLMGLLGLVIAIPGIDLLSGGARLTFGQAFLLSGIDFVVVAIGLFGVGEVLFSLDESIARGAIPVPRRLRELLPSGADLRTTFPTILRSTGLGFLVGAAPGAGTNIATFLAYGVARSLSPRPDTFGKGDIRGVAAPEAADNAATSGAFIPLMTLGLPGNSATAMMLAALVIAGLQPGPLLMEQQPEFFWTVVASMYLGNVALLLINLPCAPLLAGLLRIRFYYLYPLILGVASIGAFSLSNSIADVWLMLGFGVLGYALRKGDFPLAPVVLGVVLGPILERSFRQSLIMFDGDPTGFVARPIAVSMIAIAAAVVVAPLVVARTRRQPA